MIGRCDICGDRAYLHQVVIEPGHRSKVIRNGFEKVVWIDPRTALVCDRHQLQRPRRERLPREGTKPGTSKLRPQKEQLW
jgi:hypothetical protein